MVIRNKTARRLSVRIPRWANKRAVQVKLGTESVSPSWLGNYVILDTIRPGDRGTITFPMVTTTERYTVKWKLNQMWQRANPQYRSTLVSPCLNETLRRGPWPSGLPSSASKTGVARPTSTVTGPEACAWIAT